MSENRPDVTTDSVIATVREMHVKLPQSYDGDPQVQQAETLGLIAAATMTLALEVRQLQEELRELRLRAQEELREPRCPECGVAEGFAHHESCPHG